MTFRAVFDVLAQFSFEDKIINSNKTVTTYNMIFFLFVDFLPIISQTSSLVFGLLRHRQQSVKNLQSLRNLSSGSNEDQISADSDSNVVKESDSTTEASVY